MSAPTMAVSPARRYDRLEGQLEHDFERHVLTGCDGLPDELMEAYRKGREDGIELARFKASLEDGE